jgi:hypothetical protein
MLVEGNYTGTREDEKWIIRGPTSDEGSNNLRKIDSVFWSNFEAIEGNQYSSLIQQDLSPV